MARRSYPRGIRRWRTGWQVYCRVRGQLFHRERGPETTIDELVIARDLLRAESRQAVLGILPPKDLEAETLAAGAVRYLAARKSMTTYAARERDIGLWVGALGSRPWRAITTVEIQTVAEGWRTGGPKMVQRRAPGSRTAGARRQATWVPIAAPLSASTVNHRLRALENFYSVMLGSKRANNPVRAVPEYEEPEYQPREIPLAIVVDLLAALPDRGPGERGKARGGVSKSKARLTVMAWTGLPPAQLMAIRAQDVHPATQSVWIAGRKKGKGTEGQERPLTARGLAAFQELQAAGAFGPFTWSTCYRAWRRACAKVEADLTAQRDAWLAAHPGQEAPPVPELSRVRPYDLRHTYATLTLRATHDEGATGALLGHSGRKTTRKYTKGAVPEWLRGATALIDAAQQMGEGAKVG